MLTIYTLRLFVNYISCYLNNFHFSFSYHILRKVMGSSLDDTYSEMKEIIDSIDEIEGKMHFSTITTAGSFLIEDFETDRDFEFSDVGDDVNFITQDIICSNIWI